MQKLSKMDLTLKLLKIISTRKAPKMEFKQFDPQIQPLKICKKNLEQCS